MRMSKSKINTYRKCPREFKYIYIDGYESEPNEYMKLGLDVHKIAEDIALALQDKTKLGTVTKQDVNQLFNNIQINSNFDLTPHLKSLYHFFIDIIAVSKYKIIGVEEHIFDDVTNMYGIIDLILEDPQTGDLIIIDYKSGKSQAITKYRLELCIYKMLLNYKYPNKKVISAAIFFTKDGKYRGLNFVEQQKKGSYITNEDCQAVSMYIKHINKRIANHDFFPKKQFLCKYCNFQEQCKIDGGF